MPPSRPCEQCHVVKRCRLYRDDSAPTPLFVYLCSRCARELGYADPR